MAILKNTKVALGVEIADIYWTPCEIHVLPLDGMVVVVMHGFANKEAADTAKTAGVLKAKQEKEQREWRVRRTAWEASHDKGEPFTEPEPFEDIPLMPDFLRGEPIKVEGEDYVALERGTLKKSLWPTAYSVVKDPRFSNQFEGARDA